MKEARSIPHSQYSSRSLSESLAFTGSPTAMPTSAFSGTVRVVLRPSLNLGERLAGSSSTAVTVTVTVPVSVPPFPSDAT